MDKLTVHTRHRAINVGNKNPDSILRNILPGMANVCKLHTTVKEELFGVPVILVFKIS